MVRIVNVSDTGAGLEIAATGQYAEHGEEVDVENADLAAKLVATGLWARATTKAAKAAAKEGS
jgi:hypothetical protein